jgi:hypothetical protein
MVTAAKFREVVKTRAARLADDTNHGGQKWQERTNAPTE